MSYHYSKYEFVGPESDLERYRFRSASSSSLLVCFDGISVGTVWKAISVETYPGRTQFPVPNSICPGWMLRAGPRGAARGRTSGV
jgi:hypothetical protein